VSTADWRSAITAGTWEIQPEASPISGTLCRSLSLIPPSPRRLATGWFTIKSYFDAQFDEFMRLSGLPTSQALSAGPSKHVERDVSSYSLNYKDLAVFEKSSFFPFNSVYSVFPFVDQKPQILGVMHCHFLLVALIASIEITSAIPVSHFPQNLVERTDISLRSRSNDLALLHTRTPLTWTFKKFVNSPGKAAEAVFNSKIGDWLREVTPEAATAYVYS